MQSSIYQRFYGWKYLINTNWGRKVLFIGLCGCFFLYYIIPLSYNRVYDRFFYGSGKSCMERLVIFDLMLIFSPQGKFIKVGLFTHYTCRLSNCATDLIWQPVDYRLQYRPIYTILLQMHFSTCFLVDHISGGHLDLYMWIQCNHVKLCVSAALISAHNHTQLHIAISHICKKLLPISAHSCIDL